MVLTIRLRRLSTRKGGGDPADFDFGPAEIDQQAQGLARRPQVVAALRKMHFAQRGNHLKFGDDLVLDQQAGGIFANDHAIAKDDGTPLLNPNFRISWARALSEAFSTNPCPGKLATLNAHEMICWGAGPNNRASPTSLLIPLHPP
jgi:hypothetical protein